MTSADVLRDLDDMIQSRSILQHPFYQAWEQGVLTKAQLATYARVYYPHVSAFPSYLESTIRHADDPDIRSELTSNLEDERGNPAPHDELWLDFAEHLGLDRHGVASSPRHPAADAMVATYESLTRQSLPTGLAALYAYESQQPEVACTKIDGLRAHYGMSDPSALAYFEVHSTADVRHRQGEREALAACIKSGTPADVVSDATGRALDAYWHLLDGVCAASGIQS
jgi:pyrroloquinoline-quinone synthase